MTASWIIFSEIFKISCFQLGHEIEKLSNGHRWNRTRKLQENLGAEATAFDGGGEPTVRSGHFLHVSLTRR